MDEPVDLTNETASAKTWQCIAGHAGEGEPYELELRYGFVVLATWPACFQHKSTRVRWLPEIAAAGRRVNDVWHGIDNHLEKHEAWSELNRWLALVDQPCQCDPPGSGEEFCSGDCETGAGRLLRGQPEARLIECNCGHQGAVADITDHVQRMKALPHNTDSDYHGLQPDPALRQQQAAIVGVVPERWYLDAIDSIRALEVEVERLTAERDRLNAAWDTTKLGRNSLADEIVSLLAEVAHLRTRCADLESLERLAQRVGTCSPSELAEAMHELFNECRRLFPASPDATEKPVQKKQR